MNVSGTDTEWVLRAPSALLGIGNIVAIYWLGVLIGGRIAGVLAAAILATSGFHIWYSQEARMYTLLALATTLYAAAAFFFVKSPSYARAALLAVCGLALVYSHPFGVLNWIAIAIGISASILLDSDFPRRALFPWVIANAAIAVGFLPWGLILIRGTGEIVGDFWAPHPSPEVIYTELYWLVGGRLVAAALLIGAAVALRSNFRTAVVLLFWAVAPVGVALIESLASTPIFVARYFIGALPALVMLAALGVAHL
jgi:mannosyltransferase